MSVVPSSMSQVFERAGWHRGRNVGVPADVPSQHPAHALLAELAGIRLKRPASNIRSITFTHVMEAASHVRPWEAALATTMVGIAQQDDGHAELYLTEREEVIGCSLVHFALWLVGRTFPEAREAIVRGEPSKPMLLPGENGVTLYGSVYLQGDPAVIGPSDLA
jgi:hypothetical protein